MEADVARQHTGEKWAAGETRFKRQEKVRYFYGSQKPGSDIRAPARLHVKPSKSYDNELEASVERDTDVESRSRGSNVRDDLSLSLGSRSDRCLDTQSGKAVQHRLQFSTQAVSETSLVKGRHKESSTESDELHVLTKNRLKTTSKSGEMTSQKSRHRYASQSQQPNVWVEETHGQKAVDSQNSKKRAIPVEFHLREDQLPLSGPTVQCKRPMNLSSQLSSLSSSSKEKPSSLVILEVKDGPTFFYKPSNHMVSDSGIGDETVIPLHGCFSQSTSGHSFSGITESHSADPTRTTSTSAYPVISSSSKVEQSSFSMFRNDPSMGIHLVGSLSLGSAARASEDSPKFRSTVSQLPRTVGLRKPDLSVLSTPQKGKAISDDDTFYMFRGGGVSELHRKQKVTAVHEPSLVSANLPISSILTLPSSMEVLHLDLPEPLSDANVVSHNSEQTCAASGIDTYSSNTHHNFGMPLPLAVNAFDPSIGFENVSEILQQKAGIKHDDIVVGPRRSRSEINQEDTAMVPESNQSSMKFEVPGPGTVSDKPKRDLSLSRDISSSGHPVNNESPIGKDSSGVPPDYVVTPSKTNLKLGKEQMDNKNIYSTGFKFPEAKFGPDMTKGPTDTHITVTADSGLESDKGFRPVNKKTNLQRAQHGKGLAGNFTHLAKSRPSNVDNSPENAISYITKSLDRNHKSIDEAKVGSKSANVSPSKHQLHSHKSKSSTSIPTKKQPTTSKLHMLSNIPVPMSHDPPAKRHSYHRPGSTPEPRETNVPSASDKQFVSTASKPVKDRKVPEIEPVEISLMASTPLVGPGSSRQSPAEAQLSVAAHDVRSSPLLFDGHLKLAPAPVPSSQRQAFENERIKPCIDSGVTAKDDNLSRVSAQLTVSEVLPLTTDVKNILKSAETSTHSPSQVPVKPRLHRSAEHLLGDAKLTVFNLAENVPLFDNAESSSSRGFQDSAKSEKAGGDNISPLMKNQGLPKSGIMRRGSDRTEMCRRGSERTILPIDQNDPSVEDLKKATSLKELCQSMASLLNIDNVKAAEMITTSLSHRQDLLEGLDADAIMDYLSHHGVLDPGILIGLDDKASNAQRNSAIVRHVEEHGNTAVALFINALRQSGQLHLASSLDTEQRIKPVSGEGYFGKDRHKGELTIRIEIESLKIIAPREPRYEKIVDTSLLGSHGLTPDASGVVVKDAADEEDFVKPRSCWCFCFSYKSKIKSLSKKDIEKQKKSEVHKHSLRNQSTSPENESKPSEETSKKDPNTKPQRTKSQEKTKKGSESSKKDISKTKDKESSKKSKSSKSKSKVSGKYSVPNKTDTTSAGQLQSESEVSCHFRADVKSRSGGQTALVEESGACRMTLGLRPYITQQPQTVQHQPFNGVGGTQGPRADKEAWDPIIMEYNPKLELIKLRAGQEELASPTRQSGNIGIMCEQWKSSGRHFQQKASQLCAKIVQELHTEIIKYFEQDRGTLVLDVVSDISSILVINICMMRAQVKCLQQEIADDSLLDKIQDMFFSRVDISDFDIRGIKLRIVLDEQELNTVLSELS